MDTCGRYTLKYMPHPEHPRVRPGRDLIYPDSQTLPIGYWDTAAYFNLVSFFYCKKF
jgi:hypothetical protein